jgi:hypothetical protein
MEIQAYIAYRLSTKPFGNSAVLGLENDPRNGRRNVLETVLV